MLAIVVQASDRFESFLALKTHISPTAAFGDKADIARLYGKPLDHLEPEAQQISHFSWRLLRHSAIRITGINRINRDELIL